MAGTLSPRGELELIYTFTQFLLMIGISASVKKPFVIFSIATFNHADRLLDTTLSLESSSVVLMFTPMDRRDSTLPNRFHIILQVHCHIEHNFVSNKTDTNVACICVLLH